MAGYYLGVDIGHTKSHALITDAEGHVLGFGTGGNGTAEHSNYDRFGRVLHQIVSQAALSAGIREGQVDGAGFGIADYDWPSERAPHRDAIAKWLELQCPLGIANDAVPGLLAGSPRGWGVCVAAGTGVNCRGWDEQRREGRVTGFGLRFGEAAGASELVAEAIKAVALAWYRGGPPTALTSALVQYAGLSNVEELLEELSLSRRDIGAEAAPLVFEVAKQGDPVALDLVRWAGRELGKLALAVGRQLDFLDSTFDVVMAGSFFRGSPLVAETMQETVLARAPGARFYRLSAPPVIGSVLLGMEVAGLDSRAMAGAREALLSAEVSPKEMKTP